MEPIGYVGGILLAICGFPLAWQSYKNKYNDINKLFLWIWYLGEWLTLIYILLKHGLDIPLFINYSLNIIFITVVLYYRYFNVRINYDNQKKKI